MEIFVYEYVFVKRIVLFLLSRLFILIWASNLVRVVRYNVYFQMCIAECWINFIFILPFSIFHVAIDISVAWPIRTESGLSRNSLSFVNKLYFPQTFKRLSRARFGFSLHSHK